MSFATRNTMKTLLTILISLSSALSKPALLENHLHGFETTLNLPDFTSVKTVPISKTHEFRKVDDNRIEEIFHANNGLIISPMEASSRHESQTPTEMGNKMGLRVYRDSEDEEATNDPQKKCKKQVQLKFCEDESEIISQMRHDGPIEKAHLMSKHEMEERIKMAKEALEHLKKYLKVESNSKTKILDPKDNQSELDEYEVFHPLMDNMGNVQLTNLISVPMTDKKFNETKPAQSLLNSGDDRRMKQLDFDFEVISGLLDDVVTQTNNKVTIFSQGEKQNTTKLVESRMDQWKNNINTFQKDVNMGINIEDRFKNEEDNNDVMHSFQANASEKENTIPHLKTEISTDDSLDKKINYNDELHSEEKIVKSNEGDAEIVITQDIKSSSNLHSDSLRLEHEINRMPELTKLTSKSHLTSTKQNDEAKHNDHQSLTFENRDNVGAEHEEKKISRIDSSGETKTSKLQEQEETSVMKVAENMLQKVKSVTNLNDESLSPDVNNLHENTERLNNIEMRNHDTDALTSRLITENNDFNKMNNFEHENVESLQPIMHRSDINQKPNENVPDHEHVPSLAKESFNTIKSLRTTFDTDSILAPPRETTVFSEDTPNLLFQSKRNEHTNMAHELDEVPIAPRWSTHTNNVQHMKSTKDNNEIPQALYNQHTENLSARKANDLGKINDSLLRKSNGHAQWSQIRNTDMSIPQTLTNVNIKPGMHSDESEMLRFDRTHEVSAKENTRWTPESSAHENSGIKPFEDHFLHMPAFRASSPDLNFKNSDTNLLRPFDSRLKNERFANDFSNLNDNSFSSGMIPVHHERVDNRDNMVQASEHMDRRQMMQKSATDYVQSWYNGRGMARGSSYNQEQINVPPSTGSGAVGLFPNANTGGCAIPLLVSCSPSVVSGSLAKSQPSYNTHSYGLTDNYKYHKKRETKKNKNPDINEKKHIKC